jgi:choline dehydrogenase
MVVVGGGTAGLTIAARLAEFASVAVIEGSYEQNSIFWVEVLIY